MKSPHIYDTIRVEIEVHVAGYRMQNLHDFHVELTQEVTRVALQKTRQRRHNVTVQGHRQL